MFLNDLFSIITEEKSEKQATFTIRLNKEHSIYSGHFPDSPITPGVCIVQIAVDLLSHLSGRNLQLTQAKNVKFLQIIRPEEHESIQYQLSWEAIENNAFTLKAVVSDGGTVFTKMSIQVGEK